MSTPTAADIHQKAMAGDGDAQFQLARLFDREGRHDVAVSWLDRAASGGHLPAMTWLGARLLVGRAAPFQPGDGAALLIRAAKAGGAEAAGRAAVLAALGIGQPQSWDVALDWLQRAAELGDPLARGQLILLTGDAEAAAAARATAPSADVWGRARKGVVLAAWLTPPPAEALSEDPRIKALPNFASPAVCAWVRERAAARLTPARVYDPEAGGRREDSIRTSSGAGFSLIDCDVVLMLLRARMAAASGLRTETFEPFNVLRYEVGQKYEPHYDFLNPEVAQFRETLARQGQRVATFLTYLNDDYVGGETAFPDLDLSFKANAGDALLFFNVDEAGQVDPRTLHAGLPPVTGEKWLLSQWIRDRPQPII